VSAVPKRVVIIGATSTIAAHVARVYTERGAELFLIARSASKLGSLCDELGTSVKGSATGDFADHKANARHVEAAISTLGGIDVAVIAHGWLADQLETESSFDVAFATLDVNFVSAVAFLIPIANHMEEKRSGHIAVMTSVAGERGRPRNYTYGAAKGATTTYLEGIRSRLYYQGVGVTDLRLGPVDTPMTIDHPKTPLFGNAARVGAGIVRAIEQRKRVAYLPWFWRIIMFIVRHLPEPIFQRFPFLSGR
jgi:decaprenylphospho-beta-D-erythro-pentofuranosid-2-ulose 2-reductase